MHRRRGEYRFGIVSVLSRHLSAEDEGRDPRSRVFSIELQVGVDALGWGEKAYVDACRRTLPRKALALLLE